MSTSKLPYRVKIQLWRKAAGRCQYEGCNKPLWIDSLTRTEFNTAYIAHIIADEPGGPRGDIKLSEKLKADISNLMLMCDEHHRLIDREDIEGHPVERLREMKRNHEDRIELVTSLAVNKRSHILLYGANIGQHYVALTWENAAQAMLPNRYPAEKPGIELSLKNSPFQDSEQSYWQIELENLRRQFTLSVQPRLVSGTIKHFSIFAAAPQPLLMELGRLVSDIHDTEVYQLHREPTTWIWQDHPQDFGYIVKESDANNNVVALNLSLSATIDNSRISSILGENASIWTLTIEVPDNDFLKSREQLSMFRLVFRQLLNRIKAKHGQDVLLHIFPAVPVSVAVEIGRVWMPKADLPMRIYDQNRQAGGFIATIDIANQLAKRHERWNIS